MREHATSDKRPDSDGAPLELRRWLAAKGTTLADWRKGERLKHDPEAPALALRRRRLALLKAR